MSTKTWVARVCERRDDTTTLRAQCRNAAKEYNATGEVETEPQDWVRSIGIWVD
jgi:hypothetical protein